MDVSRTPASRNPACYYRVQALHAATTAGSCSMEYMYLQYCFVIITVADRTLSASPEPRLCLALVKKKDRIRFDRTHPASNSGPVSTASPLSLSHAGKFPPAQRIKAVSVRVLANVRDDQGRSAPLRL